MKGERGERESMVVSFGERSRDREREKGGEVESGDRQKEREGQGEGRGGGGGRWDGVREGTFSTTPCD